MARGDMERAARYLHALYRGEDSDEARAGALLVADSLLSLRALETTAGDVWRGERPGL